MNWYATAGIIAGILQAFSAIPYIRDMFVGKTRPNAVSYVIWGFLALIAVFAQLSAGASWSIILIAVVAFNTCFIATLSLVGYGYTKYGLVDWVCLALGVVAIVVWQITSNPITALLFAVSANIISAIPTVVKTYREPHTELAFAWLIIVAASFLGILSTTQWDTANLLFPIYFLLESFIICGLALRASYKLNWVK